MARIAHVRGAPTEPTSNGATELALPFDKIWVMALLAFLPTRKSDTTPTQFLHDIARFTIRPCMLLVDVFGTTVLAKFRAAMLNFLRALCKPHNS